MPDAVGRRPGRSTFADHLNELFDTRRPGRPPGDRTGRRYSNHQVAEAIKARHPGISVSRGYLSQLRTGRKDNPTWALVRALAEFFAVEPADLVRDAPPAPLDEDLARIAEHLGVRALAFRALNLDADQLAKMTTFLQEMLAEGRGLDSASGGQQDRSETRRVDDQEPPGQSGGRP